MKLFEYRLPMIYIGTDFEFEKQYKETFQNFALIIYNNIKTFNGKEE